MADPEVRLRRELEKITNKLEVLYSAHIHNEETLDMVNELSKAKDALLLRIDEIRAMKIRGVKF